MSPTSSDSKKLTPMLRQYFAIKDQHPDCILLFRLGDFYEMFGSDAEIASSILHIALTARHKGSENEIAMCGFPHFSCEQYIRKLIKAGHKVAICDQTSDPSLPGIVERTVTRIVTPGTLLSDADDQQIRLLAAVNQRQGYWAITFCNVSTGEISAGHGQTLPDMIDQLRIRYPQEVLVTSIAKEALAPLLEQGNVSVTLTQVADGQAPEEMIASYISHTQQSEAKHLFSDEQHDVTSVLLDEMTVRNLELVRNAHDGKVYGSLLDSINATVTAAGYRLLHTMLLHPLASSDLITQRLDLVEHFTTSGQTRSHIQSQLKKSSDIEKIIAKIVLRSGTPRDLGNLFQTLSLLPDIQKLLQSDPTSISQTLAQGLSTPLEIISLLEQALNMAETLPLTAGEGKWIRSGFDAELDAIRHTVTDSTTWLQQYEAQEKEKTGIDGLKVRFNNITGFFIEISKASLRDTAVENIAHLVRKQTLVNAERFSSPALHEFEAIYLSADQKSQARQTVLFGQICQKIIEHKNTLQKLAQRLAELDVWIGLAEVAVLYHFVRPQLSSDDSLMIEGGRHPIIAKKLGKSFIPNDTYLDHEKQQLLLITGPNMGGKSTYLRQVALIQILFLIGSFVPATKAKLPLVDRIFTRIGAQDYLLRGMSTFMVEMSETANILRTATSKSLIILDEIGRGTSTYDGLSIAWALCEHLLRITQAKTLFASHYHELISVIDQLPKGKNASVAIAQHGDQVTFLYKIVPGGIGKSYGLEVARRAGLPTTLIEGAKNILKNLEEKDSPETHSQASEPTLFSTNSPPQLPHFIKELASLDCDRLTPFDALVMLKQLQQKADAEQLKVAPKG